MAMATSINFVVQDEKGSKSTISINIPSDTALVDAAEFAGEVAEDLDAVMTGQITGISMSYPVAVPGTCKASPAAGSDVEEGALFLWTTDGGFATRFRVPTIDEDLIVAGSRLIDQTDGAIIALVGTMEDGQVMTSTETVEPCDYREDDIVALDTAYESFRASKGRP